MAKTTRSERQRVALFHEVHTTLGELIAAAFDTLEGRAGDVAVLLASAELRRAAGARIVVQ